MVAVKTEDLTAATGLSLTDIIHGLQGANSRKITWTQVAALILGSAGVNTNAVLTTDLNTVTETFSRVASASAIAAGAPTAQNFVVLTIAFSPTAKVQMMLTPTVSKLYTRYYTSAGGWTTPQEVVMGDRIQTSASDATTGALLTVGAFGGNGGLLVVSEDWDAIRVGMKMRNATTGAVGVPTVAANWMGEHFAISSSAGFQIARRAGQTAIRFLTSNVWGAWDYSYSRANVLGTVSMASGVPTGALIQSGSNANGYFRRFADGTMLCWVDDRSVANVSTAEGGGFTSATATWTFPSAFISAPVLWGGGCDNAACWIAPSLPTGNTSGTAKLKSFVSQSGTVIFGLVAKGFWV